MAMSDEDIRKVANVTLVFKGVKMRLHFDKVVVEWRVKDPLERGGKSGRAKTNIFRSCFESMDECGCHFKQKWLRMDGNEIPVGSCDVLRYDSVMEALRNAVSIVAFVGEVKTFDTMNAEDIPSEEV